MNGEILIYARFMLFYLAQMMIVLTLVVSEIIANCCNTVLNTCHWRIHDFLVGDRGRGANL